MNGPKVIPAVTGAPAGTLGIPLHTTEAQRRVDFRPDDFSIAIESKGMRLAWTRAVDCPCTPLNDQTEQADPNCPLCVGSGWMYFGSPNGNDYSRVGALTDAQRAIIEDNNAYVIRGLMTSMMKQDTPWERIGALRMGTASVTVRAENRLGYYDRLVSLDSTIVFQEVVTAPSVGQSLPSRYVIDGGVNLCQSTTQSYKANIDYTVVKGRICFRSGRAPPAGTRLALHYLTHPTWLVMEWPHVARGTYLPQRTHSPDTPEGGYQALALSAVVKLEFIQTGKRPTVAATTPPVLDGDA